MTFFDCFICLIIGYLIGGFSTAITLSILVQHHDIRKTGSDNAGATNMLRSYGWRAGLFTFFIDVLKGFLATYIGLRLYSEIGAVLCGTAAVIGHTYPLYYGFKGGKGISVTIGMMALLSPWLLLITAPLIITVIAVTRIVSLGSLSGNILLVCLNWAFNREHIWVCVAISFICLLNIFSHRSNIARLLKGTEAKMNWKELSRPQIKLKLDENKETEQKKKAGDGT